MTTAPMSRSEAEQLVTELGTGHDRIAVALYTADSSPIRDFPGKARGRQ